LAIGLIYKIAGGLLDLELEVYLAKTMPELNDAQKSRFIRYYELLAEHNGRVNLTAITDPESVCEKHFADSLLASELIPAGADCVDVGTGAGFPGIPLMIVRRDIGMTLVDAIAKRVAFLELVCAELDLNATCIHARAEDLGHDSRYRERFNVALTRAVASAPVLAELTAPLLKVGGVSIMYKGAAQDQELKECQSAFDKLNVTGEIIQCSVGWGRRCLLTARKLSPTAPVYPRRPANIKKRPL